MNAEFARLFELSRFERLQLVEALWNCLAKDAAQIPVPDWQIDGAERIGIKAEANPESLATWGSVKERILQNHG